eukprot:TRINITY_DN26799_c0_g1_i1.p1 TRINITY_DN26799_c0_g1~~TRINITY_DN26799_c0_g1_i1.p1  ORF type:complete len:389 (+),score=62.71 TRINITY_DN26799_c0_g1_i1:402-1568(+)
MGRAAAAATDAYSASLAAMREHQSKMVIKFISIDGGAITQWEQRLLASSEFRTSVEKEGRKIHHNADLVIETKIYSYQAFCGELDTIDALEIGSPWLEDLTKYSFHAVVDGAMKLGMNFEALRRAYHKALEEDRGDDAEWYYLKTQELSDYIEALAEKFEVKQQLSQVLGARSQSNSDLFARFKDCEQKIQRTWERIHHGLKKRHDNKGELAVCFEKTPECPEHLEQETSSGFERSEVDKRSEQQRKEAFKKLVHSQQEFIKMKNSMKAEDLLRRLQASCKGEPVELDPITVVNRQRTDLGLRPLVDTRESMSFLPEEVAIASMLCDEKKVCESLRSVRQVLEDRRALEDVIAILGVDELTDEDKLTVERAKQIQMFFSAMDLISHYS